MAISMYETSIPRFIHTLGSLRSILEKAQAYAELKKIDASVLPNARLFPDMLPLTSQVQILSDTVKGCIARLAGVDVPSWTDDEKTLEDLRARIRKTVDFVQSVQAAQVDGGDAREIALPTRSGEPRRFTGESYLTSFVLPNVYFHATTTYALLRAAGVELGKRDFLGLP